jgi:hypothetical protein
MEQDSNMEEENKALSEPVLQPHRRSIVKCYGMLRSNGAVHRYERGGVYIFVSSPQNF